MNEQLHPFELVVDGFDGFDGGTDETDHHVLWVLCPAEGPKAVPFVLMAMLETLPFKVAVEPLLGLNLSHYDGSIDFRLTEDLIKMRKHMLKIHRDYLARKIS